jgi:hypothetical protein
LSACLLIYGKSMVTYNGNLNELCAKLGHTVCNKTK